MGAVDVEYSQDNKALEELLRAVDRPGDFCVYGRLFSPMPRVEVADVGMLSLPVPETQLRALIDVSEQAPYGKGADTVVDTSVRACRQIDSTKVQVAGGAWSDTLAEIVGRAANGLGCPPEKLSARLYKMLVYETGGFFAPHRDTEKADGMIATLAIALPAAGVGGALVVRHKGRRSTIDMNVDEPSELAFAAFYADCEHETCVVESGHRVVLVFNLCVDAADTDTPCEAPDFSGTVPDVAEQLVKWRQSEYASAKLVWLLDHDYSEAGLSFRHLKNVDAAWARVLTPAAAQAECELRAAIVHIRETGDVTGEVPYFDRRHGPHDVDMDDLEMREVYESEKWLDGWTGPDGAETPFDRIPLLPDELLPHGALDDAKPDEQRLHEASGNEGVTLERAYHRAAFVLWPRQRTLDVVSAGGVSGAVAWIEQEATREDAKHTAALCERMIGFWPTNLPRRGEAESRDRMLRVLAKLGDAQCIARFLEQVMLERYAGGENDGLLLALKAAGAAVALDFLKALTKRHVVSYANAVLRLLHASDAADHDVETAAWRTAVTAAVREALLQSRTMLATWEKHLKAYEWCRPRPKPVDDASIHALFALAWRHNLLADVAQAAAAVIEHPLAVPPERVLPAALAGLRDEVGLPETDVYRTLWRHAASSLLRRSAKPPEAPRDWRIEANIGCDCKDCVALRALCEDPEAQSGRFPLRQDRRAHLHSIIDQQELDLQHVTERRGRPYTLVCTKTRASHERRKQEYAEDVSNMRSLTQSAPAEAAGDCGVLLEQLRNSVAAGA